jgi:hypothetical protein
VKGNRREGGGRKKRRGDAGNQPSNCYPRDEEHQAERVRPKIGAKSRRPHPTEHRRTAGDVVCLAECFSPAAAGCSWILDLLGSKGGHGQQRRKAVGKKDRALQDLVSAVFTQKQTSPPGPYACTCTVVSGPVLLLTCVPFDIDGRPSHRRPCIGSLSLSRLAFPLASGPRRAFPRIRPAQLIPAAGGRGSAEEAGG